MFHGSSFSIEQEQKRLHRLNTIPPNLFSTRIPYRITNLPLLVGFVESHVVENMRTQAARWDTHGHAWVIYGIPYLMRIRQQCSVKRVNDILYNVNIYVRTGQPLLIWWQFARHCFLSQVWPKPVICVNLYELDDFGHHHG